MVDLEEKDAVEEYGVRQARECDFEVLIRLSYQLYQKLYPPFH